MKVYDGASWITATSAGATSLLRFRYVATSGQTTFSGADSASATLTYTVNNIEVMRNGVTLDTSEYTASNGTSIVLTVAAGTGDIIDIIAFKSFTAADALSAVSGGTVNGAVTITGVTTVQAGSAALPAITTTGDTNTGIFFPAADTIAFAEGGAEVARFDSSGNLGIGTASPTSKLHVVGATSATSFIKTTTTNSYNNFYTDGGTTTNSGYTGVFNSSNTRIAYLDFWDSNNIVNMVEGAYGLTFGTNNVERMRIDSSGNLLVGTANTSPATANVTGLAVGPAGRVQMSSTGGDPLIVNRQEDGDLVSLRSAGTEEGYISVSGTTVSYNGGHLSRCAQTTTAKDESLVKGTVLSNLDEMNTYTDAEGNPVENEQLNKVKVSDVEGDANVAGVFVNWTHDDAHDVDEINMAMTGDMIIRIAQGVTVQRGDLLMSAGNGTAKPQGDDIVRSKTLAKVTSTHVTCTYADGSFCVPCVLMAC
jgi:hypothetical protein